jgi:hypothetical protein
LSLALLVANSSLLSTDLGVRGNCRQQIDGLNCCGVSTTAGEYPATEPSFRRLALINIRIPRYRSGLYMLIWIGHLIRCRSTNCCAGNCYGVGGNFLRADSTDFVETTIPKSTSAPPPTHVGNCREGGYSDQEQEEWI